MSKNRIFAKELLAKMNVREKIAQVSQYVTGFHSLLRNGEEFDFKEEFKKKTAEYGALGAISNILRSDGFAIKSINEGIEPRHRVKVANQLQKYTLEHARIPIPVIIEVESNHGLQAIGSETFPTNLCMGSMFNHELYGKVMETVGKEIELSANQMAFVTMLDMARDPRWGRTEEFFGEDPYLVAKYTESGVKGLKTANVLACCKHFCATGDGFGGLNTAEVNIGKRELHDIHLYASEKAVKAGADVFMAAYNTVDGIPAHMNRYLLRDVLRDELGFEGIVLSDGFAVTRAIRQMGYDPATGAAAALKAGVDLSLGDRGAYFYLEDAIRDGLIEEEYLDEAVLRILEKKFELGLFDNPYKEDDGSLEAFISSGVQQKLSYEAAAEGAVLLKNNGVLPLKKDQKVALIGCHADNIYYQLGDYTAIQDVDNAITIKKAFQQTFDSVSYTEGWEFCGNDADMDNAVRLASESDVVVMTIGGSSARLLANPQYDDTGAALRSEYFLDCGEGCDVSDISLPGNQVELIRRIKALGKPVVLLLVAGRPYCITEANDLADAVLVTWYGGLHGAPAVCDLLTGVVNPSGKLPVSIPYAPTCLPIYYNRFENESATAQKKAYNLTYMDNLRRTLYPFGYGLSYSTFEYKSMEVTKLDKNKFQVDVTVENTSDVGGKEVVQLYIKGTGNSIRRRTRELKGYKKVYIAPHSEETVSFILGEEELRVYSVNERYEVEDAPVTILAGAGADLPLTAEIRTERNM